jgi:hypothetical protein
LESDLAFNLFFAGVSEKSLSLMSASSDSDE